MPSSMMTSSTRITTLFSLVALSVLSLTIVFGSNNILDTLTPRDTLSSLPENNIVYRRALHHARATTPAAASGSSQANPTPSQPAASSPANTPASSPAPVSSPSPSPSAQSSPAPSSSSQPPATSASPSSSAASASPSSSPPSSTLSSTASSTSNNQASSTRGVTSSSAGVTSSNANSPTTLLNNPISFTTGKSGSRPTSTGSTLTINATPTGVGGTSSGFFKNKAAVGATFSIVGIVGGLAVIMAFLTITKRYRRVREAKEDEEFFEKYPSVDFAEPVPRGYGTVEVAASDIDISMNAAPPDAYPDRAIHYGGTNPGAVLNPGDYGIAYPPSAPNNNSTPAIGNGSTHEDTESAYSTPSASHPFADPVNTSAKTAAPPVTYPRHIPGRGQEMVTTDSYYGPNGAGVGAGGMAYAQ